jgi:hypothetical protein
MERTFEQTDDIIDLGAASIETQGQPGAGQEIGALFEVGIQDA